MRANTGEESDYATNSSPLRRGRGARGRVTTTAVGLKKVVRMAMLSLACLCAVLLHGVDGNCDAVGTSVTVWPRGISALAYSNFFPNRFFFTRERIRKPRTGLEETSCNRGAAVGLTIIPSSIADNYE